MAVGTRSNIIATTLPCLYTIVQEQLTGVLTLYSMEKRSQSLDYVTSVDLWSDIIAMEYPSPHVLRLYILSRAREAGSPLKAAARAPTRGTPQDPLACFSGEG